VSFAADLAGILPELRAAAESRMDSDWSGVRSAPGAPVLNEETGEYESTTEPVYAGRGRLAFKSTVTSDLDVQSQSVVRQEPTLSLPVATSTGVTVGDVFVCTAHDNDPALVGVKVRVSGIHGGSVTARRFPCEALS
jgi:hypothetical protein